MYDVIHQILTGNVESGLNRELVISLFRDAKLMQRIVDGQKLNDIERYAAPPHKFSLPTADLRFCPLYVQCETERCSDRLYGPPHAPR